MIERLPFEIAISDVKLLKPHFDTLSIPQQVVLKAFNGLALSDEELMHWSILQGSCTYDDLGYVTSWKPVPYKAQKYDELIAILGRRSGKTDRITSTQFAYEALLGGHMAHVTKGQDVKMLFIAQDLEMSKSHLNFIYQAVMRSPLLSKEVVKFNADSLSFRNGMKIEPAARTITSSRGMAVPGWCADEVGFWYTDAQSANPDYEVERAVEYAMAQFPNSFKIITSTPYTKEGILYAGYEAGTNGLKLVDESDRDEFEDVLVVHSSTAAMANPLITKKKLVRLQKKDPEAFVRESLAQFVDSISNFIAPAVLNLAVDRKVFERPKYPRPGHPEDFIPTYVAAMDPAFRHDHFAFTIMHHDVKLGIVQDYFEEWIPEKGVPLNPSEILMQIKNRLDAYSITFIYSDQYQLEALQQLAQNQGFSIIGVDFTAGSKAKIYGSFASLVNQRRIRLLDNPEMLDQFLGLEKKRAPGGAIQINGRPGKYDDAAAACALCAHQCVWLLPHMPAPPPKPLSLLEEGMANIMARRRRAQGDNDDDDENDVFSDDSDY